MKPKNLKHPFRWETRHVLIEDGIWYVPDYHYDDCFVFPGWDHPDIFGNDNPVHVEYCSGNGTWIAEKAQAHPEINWVAVEMKFDRVRKTWAKVKNLGVDNLFIICAEAHGTTRRYFPDGSISAAYVNFPDPWPKERHAKKRLIQTPFAKTLAEKLAPEGSVTLVTDDVDYSNQMIKTFLTAPKFASLHPAPHFVTASEGYGTSYFEELWREKGKEIRYHRFGRSGA